MKTPDVAVGAIGVFTKENNCIKKLENGRLISHNAAKMPTPTSSQTCGK